MIVVTGSDGFIGRSLVSRLEGQDVIKVDMYFGGLEKIDWKNVTKVYHLGAISSTVETDIKKIYDCNIRFSLDLFEYCQEYDIPVVYASSASVYGLRLDYGYEPLNYYALSKLTVDYHVIDNIDKFTSIVGLRFYNVYGVDEASKGNQASAVWKFVDQAKVFGEVYPFEGSEDFKRDFVYVGDVCDIMMQDHESGIYDVGTSNPISFMEVAEAVADKYDARITPMPFPSHLKGKYQPYTKAKKDFPNHKFVNVIDYVKSL